MATQVQSLFGITPESYQAQQQAALDAQALQFAKLSPMQQAQMGLFRGASQLGTGLAGLMGYQDPEMQRIKARQGMLGGIDMSDPAALREAAKGADPEMAQQLIAEANKLELAAAETAKERSLGRKAEEEVKAKQAEIAADNLGLQGRAQFLMSKLPDLTPEMALGLASDKTLAKEFLKDPKLETQVVTAGGRSLLINKNTGDTIRDLGSAASSEVAALTAAIQSERLGSLQDKRAREAQAAETEKRTAVNALANAETDIDTSIATAEAALKLAPNTLLGGTTQAAMQAIPWTDAKALNNLVTSLNSDKAIGTLSQLKAQSRTGATGFGALSEKELDLILAKTRALDPTDKMFKENLKIVVDGWNRIKKSLRNERMALQGQPQQQQQATKRFNPATGKLEEVK